MEGNGGSNERITKKYTQSGDSTEARGVAGGWGHGWAGMFGLVKAGGCVATGDGDGRQATGDDDGDGDGGGGWAEATYR